MRNKIENILKKIRPDLDFNESDDFINDGYLDSFEIVTLIADIDNMFSISITPSDVVPENFCNIKAIIKLIEKYRKQ